MGWWWWWAGKDETEHLSVVYPVGNLVKKLGSSSEP